MQAIRLLALTLATSALLCAVDVTTIHRFTGANGDSQEPLVIGKDGSLYGTTTAGVFQLSPPKAAHARWTETTIYPNSGANSGANLAMAPTGEIYGVLPQGGTASCPFGPCGTVFMLTPPSAPGGAWKSEVIYSFSGPADGFLPLGGLVVGKRGELYGTTNYGGDLTTCGANGCGTVFSLTPPSAPGGPWTKATIHVFEGSPADGEFPRVSLVIGSDGTLYGTTASGGSSTGSDPGSGAVFSLTAPSVSGGAWTEAVLHSFGGTGDTAEPWGLVIGQDGSLYGTALGLYNYPVKIPSAVFKLAPPTTPGGAWTETILDIMGELKPYGTLVQGRSGTLYGTTRNGGIECWYRSGVCGTLYALTPPTAP